MRTPLHRREPPDGWTLVERTSTDWRVGWAFQWSEVYQTWLPLPGDNRFTIQPEEYLATAFDLWLGKQERSNAQNDYNAFQPAAW